MSSAKFKRKVVLCCMISAFLFMCLEVCNASGQHETSGIASPALSMRHVYLEQCSDSWNHLLMNWEKNGGGIKASLWAARNQIKNDHRSDFAAIVRKIWSLQKIDYNERSDFGSWPITKAHMEAAVWNPGIQADAFIARYMPRECTPLVNLEVLFWNRIVVRSGSRACEPRYVEIPSQMKWDPSNVSRWTLYWLLVRIDGQNKTPLIREKPDMICFENGRTWIEHSLK